MKNLNLIRLTFASLALLLSTPSFADIDIGGVTVTNAQLNQLKQKLPQYKDGKTFYHWTTERNAIRWGLQGRLDQGELDVLNTPSGSKQAYGTGFYVAESPSSSRDYGNGLVEVKVPKGTMYFDNTVAKEVLGVSLSSNQVNQLAYHLPMVRNVTGDWHVFNHIDLLQKIDVSANNNNFKNAKFFNNTLSFYENFWNGIRHSQEGKDIEALVGLSYYMDGISFIRAMNVNPTNPFDEFEPEHFGKYNNTLQEIIYKSIAKQRGEGNIPFHELNILHGRGLETENVDMGIAKTDGTFGSTANLNGKLWREHQSENVLTDLYNKVSGSNGNLDDAIRSEGIRGGGTHEGNTFLATTADIAQLKTNKYLEVEALPTDSPNTYKVHYFYPDAFHYKNLKGTLSDELFDELESHTPDKLMKDNDLRNSLNKRVIKELLDDVFKKYQNQPIDFQSPKGKSIDLLIDLISIHPFENFNGRVLRMYVAAANLQAGSSIPFHMLGDFDLIKSKKFYKQLLMDSVEPHKEMRKALIKEFFAARSENRPPNYKDMPAMKQLMNSFSSMGVDANTNLDGEHFELIRERKFLELFDDISRVEWRFSDIDSVINVFYSLDDTKAKERFMEKCIELSFFDRIDETKMADILDGIDNEDELFDLYRLLIDKGNDTVKARISKHLLENVIRKNAFDRLQDQALKEEFLKGVSKSFETGSNLTDEEFDSLIKHLYRSKGEGYEEVVSQFPIIKESSRRIKVAQFLATEKSDRSYSLLLAMSTDSNSEVYSRAYESLQELLNKYGPQERTKIINEIIEEGEGMAPGKARILADLYRKVDTKKEKEKMLDILIGYAKKAPRGNVKNEILNILSDKKDIHGIEIIIDFIGEEGSTGKYAKSSALANFFALEQEDKKKMIKDILDAEEGEISMAKRSFFIEIFAAYEEGNIAAEHPNYKSYLQSYAKQMVNNRGELQKVIIASEKLDPPSSFDVVDEFFFNDDTYVKRDSLQSAINVFEKQDINYKKTLIKKSLTKDISEVSKEELRFAGKILTSNDEMKKIFSSHKGFVPLLEVYALKEGGRDALRSVLNIYAQTETIESLELIGNHLHHSDSYIVKDVRNLGTDLFSRLDKNSQEDYIKRVLSVGLDKISNKDLDFASMIIASDTGNLADRVKDKKVFDFLQAGFKKGSGDSPYFILNSIILTKSVQGYELVKNLYSTGLSDNLINTLVKRVQEAFQNLSQEDQVKMFSQLLDGEIDKIDDFLVRTHFNLLLNQTELTKKVMAHKNFYPFIEKYLSINPSPRAQYYANLLIITGETSSMEAMLELNNPKYGDLSSIAYQKINEFFVKFKEDEQREIIRTYLAKDIDKVTDQEVRSIGRLIMDRNDLIYDFKGHKNFYSYLEKYATSFNTVQAYQRVANTFQGIGDQKSFYATVNLLNATSESQIRTSAQTQFKNLDVEAQKKVRARILSQHDKLTKPELGYYGSFFYSDENLRKLNETDPNFHPLIERWNEYFNKDAQKTDIREYLKKIKKLDCKGISKELQAGLAG